MINHASHARRNITSKNAIPHLALIAHLSLMLRIYAFHSSWLHFLPVKLKLRIRRLKIFCIRKKAKLRIICFRANPLSIAVQKSINRTVRSLLFFISVYFIEKLMETLVSEFVGKVEELTSCIMQYFLIFSKSVCDFFQYRTNRRLSSINAFVVLCCLTVTILGHAKVLLF